ncbi:D-3-phosphoglycerate dehydrogenase [Halobacillus karajensis]|uniref:phosphoglycerate dehydrogenase n=1 Tax=Halobacillus karajensis TaxID=195088 RepID=UPI0008A7C775|nr:phosphoglycerate dehydrogenase [Halobacillus karajensis]SEH77032.1 D-3-phosphoglycerate dehydrogenase [Halobacillus karajensis]
MAYKVLVSDPVNQEGLAPLLGEQGVTVDLMKDIEGYGIEDVIQEYDALIVRSETKVTRNLLASAKQLKVVGRAGVGVDNIDLDAATEYGVLVINAPDGNTISTAEHTFAMMSSLARHIPQAHQSILNGKWERKYFKGIELNKKTLGIIGMGKIGTEVARRANAAKMEIVAYDPFLTKEDAQRFDVMLCSLDSLYEQSDFITVHTPLNKDTKHMISDRAFEKMKNGVRILNCARGGIIKEDALLNAIKNGKVAGAALDVFEDEPATGHPLLDFTEVIATPHLGASTKEAQTIVAHNVSSEILEILSGKPYKNAVNKLPVSLKVGS